MRILWQLSGIFPERFWSTCCVSSSFRLPQIQCACYMHKTTYICLHTYKHRLLLPSRWNCCSIKSYSTCSTSKLYSLGKTLLQFQLFLKALWPSLKDIEMSKAQLPTGDSPKESKTYSPLRVRKEKHGELSLFNDKLI